MRNRITPIWELIGLAKTTFPLANDSNLVVSRSEGIDGEIISVRPGRVLIGYDPDDDSFPARTLDAPRQP